MGKEVHCYSVPDYASAALAAAVEDIFAQSAAARALGPRSRVLVKPNLVAKHAPEKAVTTTLPCWTPCVRRCGGVALKVSPWRIPRRAVQPAVMKSIYKASGLLAVCERHGALATRRARQRRETDGVRVKEFSLLRPVLEADIIDLPKVKTHVMTGMSCAVKNLFGTVPGLQAEFHMRFPEKEPFGEMLVDLCETVRPQLIIADGVLAMEGDGPAGGTPRALGLVLGGEDAYAVDLAVCRLMGMPAMRVPYLAAAHARGLCEAALEEALLRGDTQAAAPVADYKLPAGFADISFADKAPRALRWAVPGVEKWLAPRPKIHRSKCIGCGKCAEICPGHTITVENGKAHIVPRACIRCFCCHEMCPAKAIDVKRAGIFNL
ncbi:MAG: DUF362 domain-containing protein [Ruthenibacterium lactatiformans]